MNIDPVISLAGNLDLIDIKKEYGDLQTLVYGIISVLEQDSSKNYKIRSIKTGNKWRKLSIPHPFLRKIQEKILKNILYEDVADPLYGLEGKIYQGTKFGRSHKIICCGMKKRSVVQAATAHIKSKTFFTVDLYHAYDYVIKDMLWKVLSDFYTPLDDQKLELIDLIIQLTTFKGYLPQGAPTSTFMFNLALYYLDKWLLKILRNTNIVYTRYADDLVFSCTKYQIPKGTRKWIIDVIKKYGFPVNRNKIHYRTGIKRIPKMLGVSIKNKFFCELVEDPSIPKWIKQSYQPRLAVSRRTIERYRAIIHNELVSENPNTSLVLGIISWCCHVENEIPKRLYKPFDEFTKKHNLTHQRQKYFLK